jgi:hypothetical protein
MFTRVTAVRRTSRLAISAVALLASAVAVPSSGAAAWRAAGPPLSVPGNSTNAQGAGPTASGFDFGVEPVNPINAPVRSYFRYTGVAPGQNLTDRVQLINPSNQAKSFYLYGADAFTSPLGGGFALNKRTDPVRDAGGWVKLPVAQYSVPAQTIAIVPFQLAVPPDATPGDHVAGLVAEEIPPPTQATNSGANYLTVHRVSARIYVRVSGAIRPAISVESIVLQRTHPVLPFVDGQDSVKVIFTLANTGNVRIQLSRATIRINGLPAGTVAASSLQRPRPDSTAPNPLPDELLPRSKLLFSRSFKSLPPIDRLTVRVTLAGQDAISAVPVTTTRTVSYWIVPWLALLILALIVGGAILWRRQRRRRAMVEEAERLTSDFPVPEPHSVVRI